MRATLSNALISILLLLSVVSCENMQVDSNTVNERHSPVVAFVYSEASLTEWFEAPRKAYVQTFFKLPPSLAEDVLFGVDLELFEGVDQPLHFKGADWMALAAVDRRGFLYFQIGSEEMMNGTTSPENWQAVDLELDIQPDVWYQMRLEADFEQLKFLSFTLTGNGVNKVVDLSSHMVSYPNYMPINRPSLTFYVMAARSVERIEHEGGSASVFFDDVTGGIETNNGFRTVLQDGFENQSGLPDVPIDISGFRREDIVEGYWYKENRDARVRITDEESHSGNYSVECDATLDD